MGGSSSECYQALGRNKSSSSGVPMWFLMNVFFLDLILDALDPLECHKGNRKFLSQNSYLEKVSNLVHSFIQ